LKHGARTCVECLAALKEVMSFGRLTCGIVAGIVGIVSMVVVQWIETRLFGGPAHGSLWVAFVGGGGAVLLAADRLGLLASPYTEPTLGLHKRESSERNRDEGEKKPV
jgi:hypothetical protein